MPGEFTRAVELLERFAVAVFRQVEAERAALKQYGAGSVAAFQLELERASRERRRERRPGGHP